LPAREAHAGWLGLQKPAAAVKRKPKPPRQLEQAPKKLIDFFDKSSLQHFDLERFLIVRTIPFERKAL
jgi:hypothetical protein